PKNEKSPGQFRLRADPNQCVSLPGTGRGLNREIPELLKMRKQHFLERVTYPWLCFLLGAKKDADKNDATTNWIRQPMSGGASLFEQSMHTGEHTTKIIESLPPFSYWRPSHDKPFPPDSEQPLQRVSRARHPAPAAAKNFVQTRTVRRSRV